MKYCTVRNGYQVIDNDFISNEGNFEFSVNQESGDKLEVWKEREDGFLFVYCNKLEIGYWVNPEHVVVNS